MEFKGRYRQGNVFTSTTIVVTLLFFIFLIVILIYNGYNYYKENDLLGKVPSKFIVSKNKNEEGFGAGDIGDFLSGYFGILIGLIGALLTFLAFFMQFRANKEVQEQFVLQQFEGQFFKLLDGFQVLKNNYTIRGIKFKKDNRIDFRDFDKTKKQELFRKYEENVSKGRLEEVENYKLDNVLSHLLVKGNEIEAKDYIDYSTAGNKVFQKLLVELRVVYLVFTEVYKNFENKTGSLSDKEVKMLFTHSYYILFYGVNNYSKMYLELIKDPNLFCNSLVIENVINDLRVIQKIFLNYGIKEIENFYVEKKISKPLRIKLNHKPFKGYLDFLPVYFRTLYSMTNFICSTKLISEDQKFNYLRLIRNNLSEYEQTLLFYNWYSGLGKDWENENNSFFKKYKMIRNIKEIIIIKDIDLLKELDIKKSLVLTYFESYYSKF